MRPPVRLLLLLHPLVMTERSDAQQLAAAAYYTALPPGQLPSSTPSPTQYDDQNGKI